MAARPWWELMPARYEQELEALDRAGIMWQRDEEAIAAGYLRLNLTLSVNGEQLPLVATFPEAYPWFRFEVEAHTLSLSRHQHAAAKTLCLIPRASEHWRPKSDRLAAFLAERLPLVVRAGRDVVPSGGIVEDEQGEPLTDYYTYPRDAMLLIDGAWSVPIQERAGKLVLGIVPPPSGGRPHVLLRGAVLEVQDDHGKVLAAASGAFQARYSHRLEARWVRLDQELREFDPACFFRAVSRLDPNASRSTTHAVEQGRRIRIRAALFSEEHRWRGLGPSALGDGWVIAVRVDPSPSSPPTRTSKKTRAPGWQRANMQVAPPTHHFVRVGRAGHSDILSRIPELSPLHRSTVAVMGLGCLGAPSALEFARATVGQLRLIDDDFIDPGTGGRYPLGLSAAGLYKPTAIEEVIRRDYPHTVVQSKGFRIGVVHRGESDFDMLDEILRDASLLYDATAEYGVQYFLAEQALARNVPYVGVWGTQGGWGGVVVRIRPNETEGCWGCLQLALDSGTIPAPPFDERTGNVQPIGCADPTFTGTSFDLSEVALMGVRLAVATLCADAPTERPVYPNPHWDVAILSLRSPDGDLIAPSWSTYPLLRQPDCRACASRQRAA